jgi:ParB family chromosome partitioning protein
MKPLDHKPHTVPVTDIIVGDRHRHDLGDIDALARNIAEVGLLHPIVIRRDGTLIAGTRRLAACKTLGWQNIPVHVVELDKIARGEFAENAYRKGFLPSEIYAIWQELEPSERAEAKKRQLTGLKRGDKKPVMEIVQNGGTTRDKVGAFAGISGRTLVKIKAVIEAAKKDPQRFGPLLTEMDRSGKVDRSYTSGAEI